MQLELLLPRSILVQIYSSTCPVNFMSHVWISGLLTIEDLYLLLKA